MELILWRHAEAEYSFGSDLARALTPRGHEQAEKTATWLAARLPEKYLLVSSAAERAQATAAHLGEPLVDSTFNVGSSPVAVGQALEKLAKEHDCPVVLVAHQPFLGELAMSYVATGGVSPAVGNSAGYWLEQIDGQWRCKVAFSPQIV